MKILQTLLRTVTHQLTARVSLVTLTITDDTVELRNHGHEVLTYLTKNADHAIVKCEEIEDLLDFIGIAYQLKNELTPQGD